MRVLSFTAILLWGISSAALAGDNIGFDPLPTWAQATAIPDAGPVTDGPAVLPLLFSQHVRIEPGRTSVHSIIALKFLKPEGLAAGAINLQWRPDKDDIDVHRLAISRNGKEIDLLKSGKKFELLRREAGLEQATLDGQLTAVMQPEGLQVGDTIILSMTLSSSDPALGKHAEYVGALASNASAKSIRLRVDWPTSMPLAQRFYDLPAPKTSRSGEWQSAEWQLAEPAMFVTPKGAPSRFQLGRRVEFTDFSTWAQLAGLFQPIFDQASVIPKTGPLRDAVEEIRRGAVNPKARAAAALALVEDKVRYVNIVMGQGNYVPAKAVDTWQRRFGDCKAKTVLLAGILRELGIAADAVLVSSFGGDGLNERLPTLTQFDHVIVRTTIAGKTYWLDATRSGDGALDALGTPSFGWGLPLVSNASLVRIMPEPLLVPNSETIIAIDARAGSQKPAPTQVSQTLRGDSALIFNMAMASVPANGRDKALRDYWKEQFDDFTVGGATATFDRAKAEFRLTADGTMKLDLYQGQYETDVPTPGFKPDFEREAGPHRNAPIAIAHPNYTRWVQTIVVPDDVAQLMLGEADPIDRTLAGRHYQRKISKKGNLFRIETTTRSLVAEIPYAEALAAEKELRALDDKDYYVTIERQSPTEIKALLEKESKGLNDYLDTGRALALSGRLEEAIAQFDRAIAVDPKNAEAFEGRGMAHLQLKNLAGARADFDSAVRLGTKRPLHAVITANEAADKGDWKAAIDAVSAVLKEFPDHTHYLLARANFYSRSNDLDRAIADTRTVTRLYPNDAGARLIRINLYRRQGNDAAVIAEADELLSLKLTDPYGYVAAAKTYAALGRTDKARRAIDMALNLREEGYIYLNRAEIRPKADLAGRKADIELALKLDPADPAALGMMGSYLATRKDFRGAISSYDAAIKADPSDLTLRVMRGIANTQLGHALRADADFAYVRAEGEQNTYALNSACWEKAKASVALESALIDCNLALKISPDAAGILDSKGLVLLRLGRIDDSIAAYSAAINLSKDFASALFGRALAFERKGDAGRAAADAAMAIKASKQVRDDYRDMGLELKIL